jgi:hypothetical protein
MTLSSLKKRAEAPVPAPELAVGTVIGIIAPHYRVAVGADDQGGLAKRATGCLVEPQLGDRVLLAEHAEGRHVLTVLERGAAKGPAGATRIAVEGDLDICSHAGRLQLQAPEGVRAATAGDAEVVAKDLRLTAQRGTLVVGTLHYVGEELRSQLGRIQSVADSVESVAQRVVQRADRVYRFIAEAEQVRARYLEWAADVAVNIKSKTTIMRSSELTKIDGQQIHLG